MNKCPDGGTPTCFCCVNHRLYTSNEPGCSSCGYGGKVDMEIACALYQFAVTDRLFPTIHAARNCAEFVHASSNSKITGV